VQLTEAQEALRGERPHLESFGQVEGLAIRRRRRRDVRPLAPDVDVREEAARVRLLAELKHVREMPGGGARATGGGAVEVAVSEAYPTSATQWTTLARETDPTTSSWTLTAYAFCAL